MQKTVLAFGETLWDLLPGGAKLGGAPFNFAYRVSSLGDRGLMVSRLGRDELGDRAWDRMASLGVDMRFIQRDDRWPTGTVEISLDEHSNPDYFIVPDVAYDHVVMTEDLREIASQADCVCFGTLSQRSPTARETLEAILDASGRAWKLLDLNLRKDCFTNETIASSLEWADILRLNEDEAEYLAGFLGFPDDSLAAFGERITAKCGLSHCLVTLGERGAFAATANGRKVYGPGYEVTLVDPCGSGDAFTAGFIHRLLRGDALEDCCELGNALGAMVAAQPGATEPITPDDIHNFLQARPNRVVEPSLRQFACV